MLWPFMHKLQLWGIDLQFRNPSRCSSACHASQNRAVEGACLVVLSACAGRTFLCALRRLRQLSGLRLAERRPLEGFCHLCSADEMVCLRTSGPVLLHDPQFYFIYLCKALVQ